MMVDEKTEVVQRRLDEHVRWVDAVRFVWQRHRASFSDDFWQQNGEAMHNRALGSVNRIDSMVMFAINRMRPWVNSYVASLFFRGFQAELLADAAYDETDPVEPDDVSIRALLDRWFATEPFATVTSQAFTAGLLYPHCGFYLAVDARPKRVVDKLTVEFMPPWECVWDRRSASKESARYMGRCWWLSMEETAEQFKLTTDDEQHLCAKPDVLVDGMQHATVGAPAFPADESYYRILDMYYPRADKRCVYLLDAGAKIVRTLHEGRIPSRTADGLPDVPIEPVVLTSYPEFPLWGMPNAATIYALEYENNCYASWLAQAFKLDCLRKLFLDSAGLTDEGVENIMNAIDHAVVHVAAGELAKGMPAKWMDPPPSPATGMQHRTFTEGQFAAVQGTAPVTRGQPTPYIPATESANLTAYSETTLGMYRSVVDRAVACIAQKYLRLLDALLDAAGQDMVSVRLTDGELRQVDRAQLGLRWTIRIVDGANTPAKVEKNKADMMQAAPLLTQLATLAANPEAPPELRAAGQKLWDEMGKRFGFTDMSWQAITEEVPEDAPAPMQAAPPQAPPVAEEPGEGEQIPTGAAPPGALSLEQQAANVSDDKAVEELTHAFASE